MLRIGIKCGGDAGQRNICVQIFIYTTLSYTWLDGTLAFYPWIPRYYIGGIVHAGEDAEHFNQQRIRDVHDKHLQFFQRISLK